MRLKKYKHCVMDAIMSLFNPNEFEIFEFLEYKKTVASIRNNSVNNTRIILEKMQRDGTIVKRPVRSKKYPYRYSLGNSGPSYRIEPRILSVGIDKDKLITQAKEVKKANKRKNISGDIQLIPDPYRDIVFALKKDLIMGVIDLRYYRHPKNEIRFPSRFYEQRGNRKILRGMTELQYFSRLVNESSNFSIINWLGVTCWG